MSKLALLRITFLALAVLLAWLILRKLEIDACLDAGGSFNYALRECEIAGDIWLYFGFEARTLVCADNFRQLGSCRGNDPNLQTRSLVAARLVER
jgi:hypothetical protein